MDNNNAVLNGHCLTWRRNPNIWANSVLKNDRKSKYIFIFSRSSSVRKGLVNKISLITTCGGSMQNIWQDGIFINKMFTSCSVECTPLLRMFSLMITWTSCWTISQVSGDWRPHYAHVASILGTELSSIGTNVSPGDGVAPLGARSFAKQWW